MNQLQTSAGTFRLKPYENEADLEDAIAIVKDELFGPHRIYLDTKKMIGKEVGRRGIPDGYLLDLSSHKPQLYVVENELASHDLLRHIAVQVLRFSLSFETDQHRVKKILLSALQQSPESLKKCQEYVSKTDYRNLDHLLEQMVFEGDFGALVIIDEVPDDLETVLVTKFQFRVEVLQLEHYSNDEGKVVYRYAPFLADVTPDTESSGERLDISELDTVVVPARKEGFESVFLGEDRWYEIRIHGSMRPQIKYIAAYQVAPESAITHIAPVKSVEEWKDSRKFVVNFAEPAQKIGPIELVKTGRVKAPQNLRYTNRERLLSAENLDDVW